MSRLITVAIHTYEKALALRATLENEGIYVELNNVNLEVPGFSSGVRVRIDEADLPLALRIIENREFFASTVLPGNQRTILVPVDLSEISYKAARAAAVIAKRQNARLAFLYSYLDPYIAGNVQFTDSLTYEIGEPGARQQMVENARRLLSNFTDRLKDDMKRGKIPVVAFTQSVVEGVPEDAIVEYGKTFPPHMVIMGTRGAERKERELIGSVTAEILNEGRFTVLTVPAPLPVETVLEPQNILFLGNLDQDDILAMDSLYRLFGKQGASVTIIHMPKKRRYADSSADKALRRLSDYCSRNFTQYNFISVPVKESAGYEEFLKLNNENNYDLVVVPNRRRNAFSRLLAPSVANKILSRMDIPMLVIPV